MGAHYDTRRRADEENPNLPVIGANDGASGVAVLLELARTLGDIEPRHDVAIRDILQVSIVQYQIAVVRFGVDWSGGE